MIFHVDVIGYNAELFAENYSEYIIDTESAWDNYCFTLDAPQFIYDEIKELREEAIEIVEEMALPF